MKAVLRISVTLGFVSLSLIAAKAETVGDIRVCYNCDNSVFVSLFGVQDGPIFAIDNTSGTAITSGVLTIDDTADGLVDSFDLGTIAAAATFYVEPGVTNDGESHTAGNFFSVTGGIRDTSDVGPNSDSVPFEFTGLQGSVKIDSGVFTPNASKGPSNDGTIGTINFLGGGPESDGPCNDCFGPKIVATLSTPSTSTVPEPGSLSLLVMGLAGVAGCALAQAEGVD